MPNDKDWRKRVYGKMGEYLEQNISASHVFCGDPIPRGPDGKVHTAFGS